MSTNSVMPSGNSGAPSSNIGFSKNENLTSPLADTSTSFPSSPQQGDSIQIGQKNSKDNSSQAPLQGAESTVLNDLTNLANTLNKADAGNNADSGSNENSIFKNLLGAVGKQELQQGIKDGNLDEAKSGLKALEESSKDASSGNGANNQDSTAGQVQALASEVTDLLKTLVKDLGNSQSQIKPDSSDSSDNADGGPSVKQLLTDLAKSLTNSGDGGGPSSGGPAAAAAPGAAPGGAAPAAGAAAGAPAGATAGGTIAPLGTGPSYQSGINAGEQSINHLLGTMSSGGPGTGSGVGADASGPSGMPPGAGSQAPSGTGGVVTPTGAAAPGAAGAPGASASGGSGWNPQTESMLGSQLESQGYSLVKNAQSEPGVGAAALQGSGGQSSSPQGSAAQAPLTTAAPPEDTSAGLG